MIYFGCFSKENKSDKFEIFTTIVHVHVDFQNYSALSFPWVVAESRHARYLPSALSFHWIELQHNMTAHTNVYERVSQISAIYLFLCVFYAILRCKSFKIRANVLIELLKIYKNMVLTSFLNSFQPPSIRISLILHLNSVHIKPQQLNRFDSCTDTA